MKRDQILLLPLLALIFSASFSFRNHKTGNSYAADYNMRLGRLGSQLKQLHALFRFADPQKNKVDLQRNISNVRLALKQADFWLRYLEPVHYRKINGPLPVEWETEVFEKFEKPYRREGAGLTLATLYLEEPEVEIDSLLNLIAPAIKASEIFLNDTITEQLGSYHHFFLANRLFLLNLAAIYTTGFECPDPERVIPELRIMMQAVSEIYDSFAASFPEKAPGGNYLDLFRRAIAFVNNEPASPELFDHFTFIREFVNPLYSLNQQMIADYNVKTKSFVDFSLNNNVRSIFSKHLYKGQNTRGIFHRVNDPEILAEIDRLGKLLFFDPLLSGNNLRSCASCHHPELAFSDTNGTTSLHFDRISRLHRNTPSLINAPFNHLLMADGAHTSLQEQAHAVITNSSEMSCHEKDLISKIKSCKEYNISFGKLLKYTPQEPSLGLNHVSSVLTHYYSKFSFNTSPFDLAMNKKTEINEDAKKGFNLFMSKAQCATCHFVPQFNGVKPPYVSSEFEVIGVPSDTSFSSLSRDEGRHLINPARETRNAFRTGTLRNMSNTRPYMHNGVFNTLEEVINFYDAGGGSGRGLIVENQTLSSDSLHLSKDEKRFLIAFIRSLDETIPTETKPDHLPESRLRALNKRKPGGEY